MGRFGTHLSQPLADSGPNPLTEQALATHDAAIQGEEDKILADRVEELSIEDDDDKDSLTLASIKSVTSAATGTVYSLMETAHPAFRKLKRLWNSPLESHREVCAVLAAISEVVKTKEGKDSETEYFGALMTTLETSEDEKSAMAVSFLLSLILPKVPREVLIAQYSPACKILADKLATYETSNSTSLLKSLVSCLSTLLEAQGQSTWTEGYTQRVFQLLLNYTIHPKPRLRKSAQSGVVSLLREGTLSGDFHPSSSLIARHCKHALEREGLESTTLHVLGMLNDCLANFPTQHVKMLCECLLKLMTLGNSMVRTTGLKVLNGLFASTAGPQGLTSDLNAQLLSALYDYQPSLVDAQLLQAWLTVLQSAYSKLSDLKPDLFIAHLPRLFISCVGCLLSDKDSVKATAVTVMETLLKHHVPPNLNQLRATTTPAGKESKHKAMKSGESLILSSLKAIFKALESGLKYKYCSSWDHVLKVFTVFYQVAGDLGQCHSFMSQALVTICDLRVSPEFPFKTEVDAVFGAAVKSMGVRIVLTATPLQLDPDEGGVSGSHDFPRSWLLPVLRDNVERDELSYFTGVLLPLAGKLQATGVQMSQSGNPLEAKLYDTLQFQIWSLLPGFCNAPTDLCKSFGGIARILGTALKEKPGLRSIVCHALKLLIESNKDNDENRKELGRFSKNYLPILFELYIGTASEGGQGTSSLADRGPLIACIKAYVSITDSKLLESFLANTLSKLGEDQVALSSKRLLVDLVHSFIPHLSRGSLDQVFTVISPMLDAGNSAMQKNAYSCLECLLSCSSPTHQIFTAEHLDDLRKLLLESLSTASMASKKPRLKCLQHIVDHLSPQSSDFIAAVLPEVILCTKEVNEKTRLLSFKLVIRLGYAAQKCYQKNAEGCVMEYFVKVLAGLAGSAHMISATILVLSRLVYEFHDLLGTDFVKRLLSTVCAFLNSKTREVVRSTLEFMKVTIGVLPADELLSHLEDLVSSVTSWSDNNSGHFRTKSRDILERLVRKFGYEVVASFVPIKHKKLVAHIRKSVERQKRKKKQAKEAGAGLSQNPR